MHVAPVNERVNVFQQRTLSRREMLCADEVHVWLVSLDRLDGIVETAEEVLAPDEVERAQRFYFEVHVNRFIAARAYLRKLLGVYLGIDPSEVKFEYGQYGKPTLVESNNPEGLSFNLSHAGSFALYGLTLKRQIGVDLECIRTEFIGEEVARRYFAPGEVNQLDHVPLAMRQRAFFNCWTRKEAFIKATGKGLSLPLDQFDVTLALDKPAALLQTQWDPGEASRWSMAALEVENDYVAAVAVEGHDWKVRTWRLNDDTSLERSVDFSSKSKLFENC